MGIWSWGAEKEQNQKPEGPSRIISTRRMKLSEIEELLNSSGNVFDKKSAAHFRLNQEPSFYEMTKSADDCDLIVKINECSTVARYNDEVAAARGETPEMLSQKPPKDCWTRPLEYGDRLRMRHMVPHNHSLSDHEVKDVINSEPVVVPFNLEVSMLTDKEFDARASALLEEGIRSEIEAFRKTTPIISEEPHPWISSEESSDAP